MVYNYNSLKLFILTQIEKYFFYMSTNGIPYKHILSCNTYKYDHGLSFYVF